MFERKIRARCVLGGIVTIGGIILVGNVTGILMILLISTEFGVYGLLGATTIYVIIISILNYRKMRNIIFYKQEVKKTFFYPIIWQRLWDFL